MRDVSDAAAGKERGLAAELQAEKERGVVCAQQLSFLWPFAAVPLQFVR